MKKFTEWLEETHPECIEEGWQNWAKNAAIAGAIGASAFGIGKYSGSNSSEVQSSKYSKVFAPIKKDMERQREKGRQIIQQGRTSGTFEKGALIPNDSVQRNTSDDANDFL